MYNFTKFWQYGGHWLGVVRHWVQCKKYNGSTVTWGTEEILNPPMSIRQVEEIAKLAAVAGGNEIMVKVIAIIRKNIAFLRNSATKEDQSGGDGTYVRWHCDVLEAIVKELEELMQ